MASDHEELGGGSKTHVKESQLPDTLSTSRNLMMRDGAPHSETRRAVSGGMRASGAVHVTLREARGRARDRAAYLPSRLCRMTDSLISSAYTQALEVIGSVEPRIADATRQELADQRGSLKLIASENYASPAVLLTMGTWFSDKYAEGTVGHRFYAGCQNVDTVESLAAEHARELFGAPYAYVQPHSGIDANLVAFWSILANRVETPGAGEAAGQERQRAVRGRLGVAAPRAGQPAPARHVARRRRPPDPRLPPQHQRQDVPPAAVRHRPGDRAARLRRGRRQGPRVQAAGAGRRLLGVPAPGELRQDARDRRRGRRRADGRHGALRRARRRQGLHRRGGPRPLRPHHDHHDPQVAARPARRHGAGAGGVRRRRRPRLPDGARRPAVARDGRQGRRLRRGPPQLVPAPTPSRSPTTPSRSPTASSSATPASSPAAPTTTSCCSTCPASA